MMADCCRCKYDASEQSCFYQRLTLALKWRECTHRILFLHHLSLERRRGRIVPFDIVANKPRDDGARVLHRDEMGTFPIKHVCGRGAGKRVVVAVVF
jgi:hypothetical protein